MKCILMDDQLLKKKKKPMLGNTQWLISLFTLEALNKGFLLF